MTSGNPTLDKNLEAIAKYNPQLKEKLLNLPCLTNDIQLGETNLKEPNLYFNGNLLHSQKGAEAEAKEIFAKSNNEKLCINVIFGIGLGFLFKEFADNALGNIVLYEPNLEILRVTLELVDFSKELSQKNVFVASDFKELKEAFGYAHQYKSVVDIVVLDSYKKLWAKEITETIKQLEMFKSSFSSDVNLINKMGLRFLLAVLENLPYTIAAAPLGEFKNIYEGKTAVVVSAGPTMDSNVETIKKNREKFVLFCVGPALKTLLKHGVKPDFINIVEIADVSGQVYQTDLSEFNLIVAPYTNSTVQKIKVGKKLLFPSSATRGGQYWSHLTGIDISDYISKGTVSSAALASAKILGCKKLILVGQDLAFLNNSCYSKDSAYAYMKFETNKETGKPEYIIDDLESYAKHNLSGGQNKTSEEIRRSAQNKINILNERLCFVKSVEGENLPTTIDYAMFIDVFKEFAYENKDLKLINTSLIGAQIDGFENMPLEEALENEDEFDKQNLISDFKIDKQNVLNNLEKEKTYYQKILEQIEKTKEPFLKFEKELKRRNIVTDDAKKHYFVISQVFDDLTDKCFKNNLFYQILVFEETAQIQHYVKSTQDSEGEKIKNLAVLLRNYFSQIELKSKKILEAVDKQISIMKDNKES